MALTPLQYADKLRLAISEIERENKPLAIAASTMTARMSTRIFVKGLDVNERSIGKYSTKPIYLSPEQLRELKMTGQSTRKGKTGSDTFKSGKKGKHKTTYFAGWKAVREAAGKPTDVVNLDFIGDLKSDFAASSLLRVDVHEYNVKFRGINEQKAFGNEEHFGRTIFTPSQDERKEFFDTAQYELQQLISK